MYHFEKNAKIFSFEGFRKNVWSGDRKNVSRGPALALDGPGRTYCLGRPYAGLCTKFLVICLYKRIFGTHDVWLID